eukprot:COSAG02_NODE_2483_length_8721_cov_37.896312_1_plen_587_part_00
MSSGESDDDELELLSPASHAARFARRFSDDEDDDDSSELEDDLSDNAEAVSASEGNRAKRSTAIGDASGGLQSEWSAALGEGGNSLSDDSDSDASASADDDAVAEQMRKEYETYQREREERAKAAAEAAARAAATREAATARDVRSAVDSDAPSSENLQIVAAALRANRQLQECIRRQLDKLEGARLANATALAEWQQDQRRVRQADRAMRGLVKRQYATAQGGARPATVRYRQGGSYFGRDAPAPGDAAVQQARRTVVELVPLTYPSAHWSDAETEKLREAVRQSCQHRAMVLLDQQNAQEDVAEVNFGPSDHADEGDEYTQRVNELRNLTLLQLLQRLEEDGALASGGAVCGGEDGKDLINWNDAAKRARLHRTADDCRVHWNAVADPRIDVSKWTGAETDTLKTLAEQHEGHSWERIASQVGSGRRTAFSCFQKYQSTKNTSQLGRRAWDDPAENAHLVELVQELGTKWKEIARRLGTGRKPEACMHRYRYAVGIDDAATADKPNNSTATEAIVVRDSAKTMRRGKWSPEEDVRLQEAVQFYIEQLEHDLAKGIKRKRTGRLPAGARGDRAADGQAIQIPWCD